MSIITCTVTLLPVQHPHGLKHELRIIRPDRPELARLDWMNTSVLRGCYPDIFNKCYTGAVEFTECELHTISNLANRCWKEPEAVARPSGINFARRRR